MNNRIDDELAKVDVNAAIESLGRTALRIADERNALLAACKNASRELHRFPDMQGPMLAAIDAAIAKAEARHA